MCCEVKEAGKLSGYSQFFSVKTQQICRPEAEQDLFIDGSSLAGRPLYGNKTHSVAVKLTVWQYIILNSHKTHNMAKKKHSMAITLQVWH